MKKVIYFHDEFNPMTGHSSNNAQENVRTRSGTWLLTEKIDQYIRCRPVACDATTTGFLRTVDSVSQFTSFSLIFLIIDWHRAFILTRSGLACSVPENNQFQNSYYRCDPKKEHGSKHPEDDAKYFLFPKWYVSFFSGRNMKVGTIWTIVNELR